MIRVRVPATSANLGPGFDTLGMALKFYNYFEAQPSKNLAVKILESTCVDVTGLSLEPSNNLLVQAYTHYFETRNISLKPATLAIEAHVPLARGLGSSSTAIVAGLVLADEMSGDSLGKEALVSMATALEGHPDNVVPALLGGTHCCLSNGASMALVWPEPWKIILVIPPNPLETHKARQVMPGSYSCTEVVETLQGMAAWIYALEHQDETKFSYALRADRLHQPARGKLIPEFSLLQNLCKDLPTLGCVISGAGSTCAIFSPHEAGHKETLEALKVHPDLKHCRVITVQPDEKGAQVINN